MSVERGTAGAGSRADELRFAQLYERYQRPIWDFLVRRIPRDTVDDAVADTFLTAWRCLDEVPGGDAALLWMYGVAHRVVGHQRRSLSRRGRLHERLRTVEYHPALAADDAIVDDVESRRILVALSRLGQTDAAKATRMRRDSTSSTIASSSPCRGSGRPTPTSCAL